ncbi:MAG: hypothetical protein KDA21_14635, partial [Phycisphaerales bacterium]|nr:hypothetical protein [Phycisphaerales bacterium]
APFVTFSLGRLSGPMLLDVGSRGGVQLTTFEGVEFESEPRRASRSVRAREAYEELMGRASGDAKWGPLTLRDPILGLGPPPAQIGQEVLRHYVVTFDQPRRLVRLEGPDLIEMPSRVGSGISYDLGSDAWTVLGFFDVDLDPGLDIRPGDEVVAIDGSSIGELGCGKFTRRAEGVGSVTLTLRRDGRTHDVTVPLQVLVE